MKVFTMSEARYRALEREDAGKCRVCGKLAYGVEPDAREYPCEHCGANEVYGLEELLVTGELVVRCKG